MQLKNGPFDVDLIFAPHGIERFADAYARRVEIEGFPVCSIDDIIESKASANRVQEPGLGPQERGQEVQKVGVQRRLSVSS